MTTKKVVRKSTPTAHQTAYVPDESVGSEYKSRKIAGVWDVALAEKARLDGKNILLMGDTGSGKTMFGEAYASKRELLYYSLPCDVSIDPSALFGKMVPTDVAGKFKWQDGPVTQIVRNGGVLNISEVNFMLPKIAAALYPLLDNRRYIPLLAHEGEVVRAHRCDDDCAPNGNPCDKALLVIADMNPEYRGTMALNAAFQNRFTYKVQWGYQPDVEDSLVSLPTLLSMANSLRVSDDVNTPVGTNVLMDFEKIARDEELGLEFAISNFVAGFASSERYAVDKIMELNVDSLKQELNYQASNDYEDDDEVDEVDYEFDQSEVDPF